MTNRIETSVAINAPIELVWRALTDHREFGAWFGVALEGPFTAGRMARGQMTISGYEHLKWEATVKKMEAPRYFAFTWHPYAVDPEIDYSTEPPTLVEFHLEPTDTGTRLQVVETGFDALPAHRRPDALRMNEAGWSFQMQNIKGHAESQP